MTYLKKKTESDSHRSEHTVTPQDTSVISEIIRQQHKNSAELY